MSSGDGEPGPADPRRWARLWSAARIARLMLGQKSLEESMRQSMERGLRRLQVLTGPGVLFLITWEDLAARLALRLHPAQPLGWSDRQEAGATGLAAIRTPTMKSGRMGVSVARTGGQRKVRFEITVIRRDGSKMRVSTQQGTVADQPARLDLKVP